MSTPALLQETRQLFHEVPEQDQLDEDLPTSKQENRKEENFHNEGKKD